MYLLLAWCELLNFVVCISPCQLSSADSCAADGQLETMHQQNVSLEKQVADLQQTVKTVGLERDQASQQYQQYVQQLNGQLHSLASKVLT
jgi:hypothetical protein